MNKAMQQNSSALANKMFSKIMDRLVDGIVKIIDMQADHITALKAKISKIMEDVYSILWEDNSTTYESTKATSLEKQRLVNVCCDLLLPSFLKLAKKESSLSGWNVER
jgi:hypothetical protein